MSRLEPVPSTSPGPVETSVFRDLGAAGAVDTPHGQVALAMARRIDAGNEAGAAASSWAKQLTDSLDRALKGRESRSRLADLRAARTG